MVTEAEENEENEEDDGRDKMELDKRNNVMTINQEGKE